MDEKECKHETFNSLTKIVQDREIWAAGGMLFEGEEVRGGISVKEGGNRLRGGMEI